MGSFTPFRQPPVKSCLITCIQQLAFKISLNPSSFVHPLPWEIGDWGFGPDSQGGGEQGGQEGFANPGAGAGDENGRAVHFSHESANFPTAPPKQGECI
jgi:hypothetical protein